MTADTEFYGADDQSATGCAGCDQRLEGDHVCPSDAEVARMRLPIPLSGLGGITQGLERAYGKGLTMRQEGAWLLIERPEVQP